MVERTKGRRPKNRPSRHKGGGDPKTDQRKEELLEATWVRGEGTREPWRRGATDFLQVVAATVCPTVYFHSSPQAETHSGDTYSFTWLPRSTSATGFIAVSVFPRVDRPPALPCKLWLDRQGCCILEVEDEVYTGLRTISDPSSVRRDVRVIKVATTAFLHSIGLSCTSSTVSLDYAITSSPW